MYSIAPNIIEEYRNQKSDHAYVKLRVCFDSIMLGGLADSEDIAKLGQVIFETRFVSNLKIDRKPLLDLTRDCFLFALEKADQCIENKNLNLAIEILEMLYYLKQEGDQINALLAQAYEEVGRMSDALFHLNNAFCFSFRNKSIKEHIINILEKTKGKSESSHYLNLPTKQVEALPFSYNVNAPIIKYYTHEVLASRKTRWFFGDSHADVFLYIATHGLNKHDSIAAVVIPGASASALGSSVFVPSIKDIVAYLMPMMREQDEVFFLFGSIDVHYFSPDKFGGIQIAHRIFNHIIQVYAAFIEKTISRELPITLLGINPPGTDATSINVWGKGPYSLHQNQRIELVGLYNQMLRSLAERKGYLYAGILDQITTSKNNTVVVASQYLINPQEDHLNNQTLASIWCNKLLL